MTTHDENATIDPTTAIPSEPPPATTTIAPPAAVRRGATLGLLAAFVMGIASGASGDRAYMAHGAEVRDWYSDFVESRRGAWSDAEAAIPVSSEDPTHGPRDALVTIVQFSDFQCPFCSRVEPTMAKIRATYGDDVRIVWKSSPLPFHDHARPAAEAAQAVFAIAGKRAFWKFHDLAFADQQHLTGDNFVAWAKQAGVTDADVPRFQKALADHAGAAKVDADLALAKNVGVRGTPVSFVNGVMVPGAQPFDAFKKVIDEQLAKAKERVAAGTARDRLYVAVSQENAKNAPKEPDAAPKAPDADTKTVHDVPIDGAPILGKSDAKVTIVAFSDFQCPFCKRAEETLAAVRQAYGDKVRIVWRDAPLPFHPRARPAAQLAREARAEKGDAIFWKAHDAIFASQPKLDDEDLRRIASGLKLDAKKVDAALAAGAFDAPIAADQKIGEGLGVQGTPTFFIDGRRLVGAQPLDAFKAIIDEELAKPAK